MLEPTAGRYSVEAAIPGIAGTGDEVVVDPNERSILVTRRVAWSKYRQLMEHRDHLRSVTETAEPLLPMYAFEAMADALRPLATGLAGFDYESDSFTFFVDESSDLTGEGEHLLAELIGDLLEVQSGATHLVDIKVGCELNWSQARAKVKRRRITRESYPDASTTHGPKTAPLTVPCRGLRVKARRHV